MITTSADEALVVYDAYVDWSESENWVKNITRACRAERLRCHRFSANQCSHLLHPGAYWSLDSLRHWLARAQSARTQLDTPRLCLLNTRGRARELATDVRRHLAAGDPGEPSRHLLAARRVHS